MVAQYWSMTGQDIWMLVNPVCELKNLVTGEKLQLNVSIPEKFKPVRMPEVKTGQKNKSQQKKSKKVIKSNERKMTRASKPRANASSRYRASQYKGVRQDISSGRWEAKYYDKGQKRVIYIGMFDDELLAAAAVQEKHGNRKEARRLRNEYEEGDKVGVKISGNSSSNETINVRVTGGMQPGDFPGA